jgi:hypothetical protein
MLQPTMMQHGPGLAASPPARNNLEVGRRGLLFLRFSAVGGQSLYEAAVRVLLFEQPWVSASTKHQDVGAEYGKPL